MIVHPYPNNLELTSTDIFVLSNVWIVRLNTSYFRVSIFGLELIKLPSFLFWNSINFYNYGEIALSCGDKYIDSDCNLVDDISLAWRLENHIKNRYEIATRKPFRDGKLSQLWLDEYRFNYFIIYDTETDSHVKIHLPGIFEAKMSSDGYTILILTKENLCIMDNPIC